MVEGCASEPKGSGFDSPPGCSGRVRSGQNGVGRRDDTARGGDPRSSGGWPPPKDGPGPGIGVKEEPWPGERGNQREPWPGERGKERRGPRDRRNDRGPEGGGRTGNQSFYISLEVREEVKGSHHDAYIRI